MSATIQVPLVPMIPVDPVRFRRPHRHSKDWRTGLGAGAPQIISTSGGLIASATGIAVTTGAIAAGGTLAAIGAVAGPIGAIAGVLAGLLMNIFSGCGQSCVLTSDAANQIENALKQNLAAYFSSGRTQAEQAAALANFDNTWAKLVQYCGQPSFGTAGQNCVQDRQAGACKWQASPPSWNGCQFVPAGPAGSGSTCWNWFIGYRDPIANDPCVVSNPATEGISTAVNQMWSSLGLSSSSLSSLLPLLLIGGLAVVALSLS